MRYRRAESETKSYSAGSGFHVILGDTLLGGAFGFFLWRGKCGVLLQEVLRKAKVDEFQAFLVVL